MTNRLLAALLLAAGLVTASAGSAAAAPPVGQVQISAIPASGTPLGLSGGHQVVMLQLKPTASWTLYLHLTNPYSVAEPVVLRGVDGFTDNTTGFGFTAVDQAVQADGTWVSIATPQLNLGPGESRDVPITVTAPADASPGQHLAGISVYTPVTMPSSVATNGKLTVKMILQPQRVVAVQVDVPGQAAANLVVSGARPVATADGIALAVAMANQGTAIAHGTGVLTVPSTGLRAEFSIGAFVPRTAVELSLPWTKTIVAGQHDVKVVLAYDDGRSTEWTGTVDVTGGALTRLRDDLATKTAQPSSHTDWFSTDRLLIALGVVVAIAVLVIVRRRPRHGSPDDNDDVRDVLRRYGLSDLVGGDHPEAVS